MTLNLELHKIPSRDEVLYISFNQDNSCFAVGTDGGFRIYNADPYREIYRRNFKEGGVGIAEMLFRCNILALVGGGKKPCWPPDTVQIWDDHQSGRVIKELKHPDPVRAVRLQRDRIYCATESVVYVYSFQELSRQHNYDTADNPMGIFAVAPTFLVCPAGKGQTGIVRIENHKEDLGGFIKAHDSSVAMISLNADGTYMATASEKGTLIRVFDTTSHKMVREFRRGSEKAAVYSLCFSPDSKFLAACSSHGTVHVFSLEGENRKSAFGGILRAVPRIGDYFESEWSQIQFKGTSEGPSICVFGPQADTLFVASACGRLLKIRVDIEGRKCVVEKDFPFPNM